MQAQIERRQRPDRHVPVAHQNRRRHLLSGLIKCSRCGASSMISGKDYYRCACQKGRGTCTNTIAVLKEPVEAATLAALQSDLLTAEHARLFAEEFARETARMDAASWQQDKVATDGLAVVAHEIDNLAANMLTWVVSATFLTLLAEREADNASLERRLSSNMKAPTTTTILPHAALLQLFQQKVSKLRETLDAEIIRGEAAEILSTLIESVTIHPKGGHGPEAEVVAKVSDLLAWATNDNTAPKGGVCSSIAVVAGTRTGRCTTSPVISI